MSEHLKGLLITALGVLFVVPDSLFVRLIGGDAASIAFWRGITAGGVILLGVLAMNGVRGFAEVARTGRPGLIYTVLIGATAPGFVFAVSLTSVANVVFILASMPVFAAIFSRVFLKEPISRRMIGSFRNTRLKIAAKTGIEARMNTTLATLVRLTAKTKPGAVAPISTV